MCFVAGSASSRSIAISVVMPPTSALRSRPPVPMAWLMPRPARAIRHETSWMPVPDAPMMPMSPRGTTLAKASGTPPMMAVPQSGPITSRPSCARLALQLDLLARGARCRRRSSRRGRARIAFRASAAAKSPGTEISARLASGICACAARSVRGRQAAPAPAVRARRIEQARRLGDRGFGRRRVLRAHGDDEIAGRRRLAGLGRARPPRAGSPCWPACRSSGRLPRRPAAPAIAREMRISATLSR